MSFSDFRKIGAVAVALVIAAVAFIYLSSRSGQVQSPAEVNVFEKGRAASVAAPGQGDSVSETGTTREFLAYYKAHKEEAKQLRAQCFARIKAGDIPKGEDRQRCSAANAVMGG